MIINNFKFTLTPQTKEEVKVTNELVKIFKDLRASFPEHDIDLESFRLFENTAEGYAYYQVDVVMEEIIDSAYFGELTKRLKAGYLNWNRTALSIFTNYLEKKMTRIRYDVHIRS